VHRGEKIPNLLPRKDCGQLRGPTGSDRGEHFPIDPNDGLEEQLKGRTRLTDRSWSEPFIPNEKDEILGDVSLGESGRIALEMIAQEMNPAPMLTLRALAQMAEHE
jgi:hypothetical protein